MSIDTWDYRIVKTSQLCNNGKNKQTDITFGIHEVYYNKEGFVVAITDQPESFCENNFNDLIDLIDSVKDVHNKEILENVPELFNGKTR